MSHETTSHVDFDANRKCPVCKTEMGLDSVLASANDTYGSISLTWECPHCGKMYVQYAASAFDPLEQI